MEKSYKSLRLWKERKDRYIVGIKGTSEWYIFHNPIEANIKYNELLNNYEKYKNN